MNELKAGGVVLTIFINVHSYLLGIVSVGRYSSR